MTLLDLENVGVEFSLYQATARSLKSIVLRTAVGGSLGTAVNTGRLVVKALEGINISLAEGDKLALIGHNGAGKTTLLRVMAGIYEPTEGRIMTQGRSVPLFDIHSGFEDEATGYENIYLRGLLMGFHHSEIEARIGEIADFSELGDYLHLPTRTYSSGMLLRLLFSISTSMPADIVLMDEWIATGDQSFVEKANLRLRQLIDSSHILVLASHDMKLLQKVCNRAALIHSGKIIMTGNVEEVIEAYGGDQRV